jgi:hypothetical protein
MIPGFPPRSATGALFSLGSLVALIALGGVALGCTDPEGDYNRFISDTDGLRGAKPPLTAGAGGASGAGGTSGVGGAAGSGVSGAGGSDAGASGAGGSAGDGGAAGAGGGSAFPDVNGTFVSFCLPGLGGGDPDYAILFSTQVMLTGNTMSFSLQAMTTTATTLTDVVGSVVSASGPVADDSTFSLNFGTANVPGVANPISGSDIEITGTRFDARILSADSMCAELGGMLTQPFMSSFEDPGDVCIIKRVTAEAVPPRPVAADFHCP